MWVFARLFWLFADSCLSLYVCCCVRFPNFAAISRAPLAHLKTFLCLSCTSEALGIHCNTWGPTFHPCWTILNCVLGRTLGFSSLFFVLRLGAPGVEQSAKRQRKGAGMNALYFHRNFKLFQTVQKYVFTAPARAG